MKNVVLTATVVLAISCGAAVAQTAAKKTTTAAGPATVGTFGKWSAHTDGSGTGKSCFVTAQPSSSEPKSAKRDPIYFYVTHRPAQNVRNEISIRIGYPFKEKSEASLDIDGTKFVLFTQNDGAWLKNTPDEGRVVEAMRKGRNMVIKGTSKRGTNTADTYVLQGVANALDKAAEACSK